MSQALSEAWSDGNGVIVPAFLFGMLGTIFFFIVKKALFDTLDPPLDDVDTFRFKIVVAVVIFSIAALLIDGHGWQVGSLGMVSFLIGCVVAVFGYRKIILPTIIDP